MCNLGTAIESKARDEGRAEGRAEGRNEGVDLMAKLVDILMEADSYHMLLSYPKERPLLRS